MPRHSAKGTYGPNAENADVENIKGAEEVTGLESMANAVRTQIGKGADFIKIYADYRYGLNKEAVPTFTEAEIKYMVDIASSISPAMPSARTWRENI